MREKIELKVQGQYYRVTGLVNRTRPAIGTFLKEAEVEDLIIEAKNSDLTVNIK